MNAKILPLLLIPALTGLDAWAAPVFLASTLIKSVRRMGLVSGDSVKRNAQTLASALEALDVGTNNPKSKVRLLGLLRETEATGAEHMWSTDDVNELVRLVTHHTEPGTEGRLFPQVIHNAEGEEVVLLKTIRNPEVAKLARAVPWSDREDLIDTLNREFPRIGLPAPSQQSLDTVADERLGIAVLIAAIVRSEKARRGPYLNHTVDNIRKRGVGFFHPSNRSDISYIESSEIFPSQRPEFYRYSTAMLSTIEAMREDLVRDMANIGRHFGGGEFGLEDFETAFGRYEGHYEGYETTTSLSMAIHLDIVEVTPEGGLRAAKPDEMDEAAVESRLNEAHPTDYANALEVSVEETVEAKRAVLRGLETIRLEDSLREEVVDETNYGDFPALVGAVEEIIEARKAALNTMVSLGFIEDLGDGRFQIAKEGTPLPIVREIAVRHIRQSFGHEPFTIDEFARLLP